MFHILTGLADDVVNEEIVHALNTTPPFKLEDFDYNNHKIMEIMFGHLSNTSFDGVTVSLVRNEPQSENLTLYVLCRDQLVLAMKESEILTNFTSISIVMLQMVAMFIHRLKHDNTLQ